MTRLRSWLRPIGLVPAAATADLARCTRKCDTVILSEIGTAGHRSRGLRRVLRPETTRFGQPGSHSSPTAIEAQIPKLSGGKADGCRRRQWNQFGADRSRGRVLELRVYQRWRTPRFYRPGRFAEPAPLAAAARPSREGIRRRLVRGRRQCDPLRREFLERGGHKDPDPLIRRADERVPLSAASRLRRHHPCPPPFLPRPGRFPVSAPQPYAGSKRLAIYF